MLVAVITLFLLVSGAQAQTPSSDDAMRAFTIVQKYIRTWSVPAQPDAAAKPPKAVGACITLKLNGKIIARGMAWSDVLAGPEAMNDDVLRRAALAAIKLGEPSLDVPNDAMRDDRIRMLAADISISVELAGPLSLVQFDTWDDAEMTLRPGLEGVAARLAPGGDAEAGTMQAIFPSQMMLGNMLPHRGLAAAASQAMGEGGAAAALDEPKKLRTQSGVRMYRFRVAQVAKSDAKAPPSVLYRGARLDSAIPSRAELEVFATRLAEHLIRRLKPGGTENERHILATVRPGSEADPAAAAPLNQLIAAYAVVKNMERVGENDPRNVQSDPAMFVQAAHYAGPTCEPGTPAMYLLVGPRILDKHKETQLFLARARGGVEAAVFGGGTGDDRGDTKDEVLKAVDPRSLAPALRPMVVMAAAEFADAPGTGRAKKTDAILRSLYKEMPEAQLVSLMPWLGWAEIARSRLASLENQPTDIPSAVSLRRMRDECWKHQLSITDAGEDAMDMAGGIVFTSGLGNGHSNPYPTWQCARPLAFIATMLRDPRLTEPHERAEQLVHLMHAMRFLRQLQVDEGSAWMYSDPKLAIGGVRASTWDNSLPVDATSMTLLCVVEMLKSLDEIAKQQAAPAPTTQAPGKPAPEPK